MAEPTTFTFGEMLIEIGDGNSPETFSAPCGLTAKGFNLQADTNDTIVPDCDDPDAPAWKQRSVAALSRDISGNGVLAAEFEQTWDDWATGGQTKNCRVTIGDFRWTGRYLLTQFDISGDLGDKLKVTVAMQSDGQISRSAAP